MGNLLPDRHPNRDFFILDVSDASAKSDMVSMEHPVYSLSVKPDTRTLKYRTSQGKRLRIHPSSEGLATIMDKDILLYCISKLVHQLNDGDEIGQWVSMSAHEVMVATNRRTSSDAYESFEKALLRLSGTRITTDIPTNTKVQIKNFGIIDEFQIDKISDDGSLGPFGRRSTVHVKLSDWTLEAVRAMEVLTIDRRYFRLRRPLERRIYEIAVKHAGQQDRVFKIGLDKLQAKVGSGAAKKRFRHELKRIIEDGHIPEFEIWMLDDIVHFRRERKLKRLGTMKLRAETMDRAQKIAAEKGLDLHAMQAEWQSLARRKGAPENPDGAFIGFLNKQRSQRQGSLL